MTTVTQKIPSGYKQTEIGVIPADWDIKRIIDFTDCTAGGTPSTLIPNYWGGNIRWMNSGELNNKKIFDVENRITEIGLKKSSTKIVPINCVLVGLAGQGKTRGTVAINKVDLSINQSIAAIYPSKNHDSDYLYFNFDNRYEEIRSLSTGGEGRGGLNLSIIRQILVAFPEKSEQTAIATVLSNVDRLIEKLEKLIGKKKNIKQGVMQELLTGKKRLPGFSGEWETNKLKDIANYRRGSFPQPYGLEKWYDDDFGLPFVQVVDVGDNFKLKNETKRRISKAGEVFSVFVKKGTIVLTIQGSIGRICITQYDACVDRTLLIFESFREKFDKYFFMLQIFQKFEIEKEKAPGGIIKTITKEALSDFEISYPKDLTEQTAIANILSDMDTEIEKLESQLTKYQNIKQGMMQTLLTGKIRLLHPVR